MRSKVRWRVLKDAVVQLAKDDPFQWPPPCRTTPLFSLAPLLIIAHSIAGFALVGMRHESDRRTIQGLVGRESAEAIQAIIQNANSSPIWRYIDCLASRVANRRRRRRWPAPDFPQYHLGVMPIPPRRLGFLRQRFISFAMVLASVSLLVSWP